MKTIKSILFILPIVIVFLSFSHSNANESEDEKSLDFFNSTSLINGNFLDRSIIREVSESFSILPNVSISDSSSCGICKFISSPDESLKFPKGSDCILSHFKVVSLSLMTDTRSVSESLSYPYHNGLR